MGACCSRAGDPKPELGTQGAQAQQPVFRQRAHCRGTMSPLTAITSDTKQQMREGSREFCSGGWSGFQGGGPSLGCAFKKWEGGGEGSRGHDTSPHVTGQGWGSRAKR